MGIREVLDAKGTRICSYRKVQKARHFANP